MWLPVESCVVRVKLQISFVFFVCVCMWQSDDDIRRKQVDTSSVKQSDKPKYVVHVSGEVVSKKYRQHYNDTPKYVMHVLGGAVSKTYRRLSESKNYRHGRYKFAPLVANHLW